MPATQCVGTVHTGFAFHNLLLLLYNIYSFAITRRGTRRRYYNIAICNVMLCMAVRLLYNNNKNNNIIIIMSIVV